MRDEQSMWRWRRKRNQSFGHWEDIRSGEQVGPIPLDDSGRPTFVPAPVDEGPKVKLYPEPNDYEVEVKALEPEAPVFCPWCARPIPGVTVKDT